MRGLELSLAPEDATGWVSAANTAVFLLLFLFFGFLAKLPLAICCFLSIDLGLHGQSRSGPVPDWP